MIWIGVGNTSDYGNGASHQLNIQYASGEDEKLMRLYQVLYLAQQ